MEAAVERMEMMLHDMLATLHDAERGYLDDDG